MTAQWSPEIIMFWSVRGSGMIAVPSAFRGRSSKMPPLSMRSFALSFTS